MSEFKTHIYGIEAPVLCYPWMTQETDITVCAHVSIWNVLRFFANQFSSYCDTTMGEIAENVEEYNGRKVPSSRLSANQMTKILSHYGFSSVLTGNLQNTYYKSVAISFIESGIPIIGLLKENHEHTVTIIGTSSPKMDLLDDIPSVEKMLIEGKGCILYLNLIESLYVMDDNLFPYTKIEETKAHNTPAYGYVEFSNFIIPLGYKMQLSYDKVEKRFLEKYKDGNFIWPKRAIIKIYSYI